MQVEFSKFVHLKKKINMKNLLLFILLIVFSKFYTQDFQKDSIVITESDTLNYQIFKIDRTKLYIVTSPEMVFKKNNIGNFETSILEGKGSIQLNYAKNDGGYIDYQTFEILLEKQKKEEKSKSIFYNYKIKKKSDGRFYCIIEKAIKISPKKMIYQIYTTYSLKDKLLSTFINIAINDETDLNVAKTQIYPVFENFAEKSIFIYEKHYPF
jgi:hypothetical protein